MKLLTLEEAAAIIGVSARQVRRYVDDGKITATYPDKRTLRIDEKELKRFTKAKGNV